VIVNTRTLNCAGKLSEWRQARRLSYGARAFTLMEVLAAMLFMAIVIPVALHGMRIASRAGEVGQRKAVAARICERVINEVLVTGQYLQSSQNGVIQEGMKEYNWVMSVDPWEYGTLRTLTVQVTYMVQNQEYEVHLSTLVDPTIQ
jgi:type II secretory pathway pseudopilin PulG